jgi:hypothetical protein
MIGYARDLIRQHPLEEKSHSRNDSSNPVARDKEDTN